MGNSDSGNRVILVVIMPPTVPFMMTTSLLTFVPLGPIVDVLGGLVFSIEAEQNKI